MSSTPRTILRMAATMAVGAGGFLAAAVGLGTGGWPATIAFACGAGLIAAAIRPDRAGFLCAWLGALTAVTALVVGGGHISDPEYGIELAVFIVVVGTLVDGVALVASFLVAAVIRRSMASRRDLAVVALGTALLLLGLVIVDVAPLGRSAASIATTALWAGLG
jgi:hypothetical protein